jgi:hypothetical protein
VRFASWARSRQTWEGKRQKNHIFYGANVGEKIERLYHSEEAALIMAHMEKLQEAA